MRRQSPRSGTEAEPSPKGTDGGAAAGAHILGELIALESKAGPVDLDSVPLIKDGRENPMRIGMGCQVWSCGMAGNFPALI